MLWLKVLFGEVYKLEKSLHLNTLIFYDSYLSTLFHKKQQLKS